MCLGCVIVDENRDLASLGFLGGFSFLGVGLVCVFWFGFGLVCFGYTLLILVLRFGGC